MTTLKDSKYQLWHDKKMTARKAENPQSLYKYIKE